MKDQIRTCHIYVIGLLPKVDFLGAAQEGQELITSFKVLARSYDLRWPLPKGAVLVNDEKEGFFVVNPEGRRFAPNGITMMARLSAEHNALDSEVLYIGQAFGEDGSRNALDRLKKHETLQKIAVQGIPDTHYLNLLMLEVLPTNRLITFFNPWTKNKEDGDRRIKRGLDKLFDTDEAERTTLYEASLIRYFQPKFNKEFRDSFPSTNMKLLKDCYAKDMAAVVAEICFDELPFRLFSKVVGPQSSHIAWHDLHDDPARKIFFSETL